MPATIATDALRPDVHVRHDDHKRPTVIAPIIVGTDGTDASEPGVAASAALSRYMNAPVQLVSVVEQRYTLVPSPEGPSVPSVEDRQIAEARLQTVREQQRLAGGEAGWTSEIKFGDPATILARLAKSRHARMLVMGKRAHGKVDQLLGDDTVFDVIRLSETPVLVVKGPVAETPKIMTIAVDFSELSTAVARTALKLFPSAELIYLVHVGPREGGVAGLAEQYVSSVSAGFERMVESLDPHTGARIDTVRLEGVPARGLVDFAETSRSDLLVVGSYRRGLFRRLAGGAMASRVMRVAACPVLIVPEAATEDVLEDETDEAAVPSVRDEAIGAVLDELTRRNAGRRVMFEADNVGAGAQLLAFDYVLLAAQLDAITGKVHLVFSGDPGSTGQTFTATLEEPETVDVQRAADGADHVVRLVNGHSQATLTFW